MSTTFKPLEAEGVPGQLCQEDKNSVAVGFNTLRLRESSPKSSGLRIVDTLASRFLFVVTNPRNVNLLLLRTLLRSVGGARQVTLDLPHNCARVECWRSSQATRKKSRKRPRQPQEILALPPSLQAALSKCQSQSVEDIVLWILNRPEDFCTFRVEVEKDVGASAYHVRLVGFDAVSDDFLLEMANQWPTAIRDVVVEWSKRSVTLVVTM